MNYRALEDKSSPYYYGEDSTYKAPKKPAISADVAYDVPVKIAVTAPPIAVASGLSYGIPLTINTEPRFA